MNFQERRYQNPIRDASGKYSKKPLAPKSAIWYPMRRFLFGDIAQLVERLNGIEKVRGSTPLISTTSNCVQIQGFPRFLVFAEVRLDMGGV